MTNDRTVDETPDTEARTYCSALHGLPFGHLYMRDRMPYPQVHCKDTRAGNRPRRAKVGKDEDMRTSTTPTRSRKVLLRVPRSRLLRRNPLPRFVASSRIRATTPSRPAAVEPASDGGRGGKPSPSADCSSLGLQGMPGKQCKLRHKPGQSAAPRMQHASDAPRPDSISPKLARREPACHECVLSMTSITSNGHRPVSA